VEYVTLRIGGIFDFKHLSRQLDLENNAKAPAIPRYKQAGANEPSEIARGLFCAI
jgi:hypothetical protein